MNAPGPPPTIPILNLLFIAMHLSVEVRHARTLLSLYACTYPEIWAKARYAY
jgi:hypothetical protein